MIERSWVFALRRRSDQRLVRLWKDSTETCFQLDMDRSLPLFMAAKLSDLVPVLIRDVEIHDSTANHPKWGDIDPSDLEIVRIDKEEKYGWIGGDPVQTIVTVHPCPTPKVVPGGNCEYRELPAGLLKAYFGASPNDRSVAVTAIILQDGIEGISPEEAIGMYTHSGHPVIATAPLPDDYPRSGWLEAQLALGRHAVIAIVDMDGNPEPIETSASRPAAKR